MLNKEQHKK